MNFIEEIKTCILSSPATEIPWEQIDQLLAATCFSDMKTTHQNPFFHGEGDVYTHTQMVCHELMKMSEFYKLTDEQRTELFSATLFHDIGKVKTTRLEGSNWVSPHHASTGGKMVREFLWSSCGLCGTAETIRFRETVSALVRYHMTPVHLMVQEKPDQKVRMVASLGELAKGFSWQLLCMLGEADVRGRIAEDTEEGLTQVAMSRMMAEEAGCMYGPYSFADSHTKHAYLGGRNVQPDQILYDDTWGEVIMLSGLPGTGKDTWIQHHHPDLPMVSLDKIRAELRIKPTDNQGKVIQTAQELARKYLRKKQPFIWNATNLMKDTRQKNIRLCEGYGSRVKIVYLETDWETRESRNTSRSDAVPESAVSRMLENVALPTPDEAQTVEWVCV